MIVEYIRYTIPDSKADHFDAAYAEAGRVLAADPHCIDVEVTRSMENRDSWIVRICWDSLDGHMNGFRKGANFPAFFRRVRPFLQNIEEMAHYAVSNAGNQ